MLFMIWEMNRVFILQRGRSNLEAVSGLYGMPSIFWFLTWILAAQLGSVYKKSLGSTLMICVFFCEHVIFKSEIYLKKYSMNWIGLFVLSLKWPLTWTRVPNVIWFGFPKEYHLRSLCLVEQVISLSLSHCYQLFFHVVFYYI